MMQTMRFAVALTCAAFAFALQAAGLPGKGICGHQGDYATCPDDTVRALRTAVEKGACMVEFDVQRCLTGEFVVIHDATLDKTTTATGRVAQSTFAYIRAAHIRHRGKVCEDRVPTFDEAIDCLPREGFWINVHCYGDDMVARDIALKLREKGRLGQAYIAATLPLIRAARKEVPELMACNMSRPVGAGTRVPYTDAQCEEYLRKTVEGRCQFLQLRQPWPRRFSDRAHAAGVKVNLCSCDHWCNDPANLERVLFELDMDFVLTENLAPVVARFRELTSK
jgi:glycerophosphoryl diester phosphodiesterase